MKNTLLLMIGIILTMVACKQSKNLIATELQQHYKIEKIRSEKSVYIIYATRNDSIFKIVTIKEDTVKKNCNSIRKGKYYNIDIEKIFPPSLTLDSIPFHYSHELSAMSFGKGIHVFIEEESHYSLYMAKNIHGLCIE